MNYEVRLLYKSVLIFRLKLTQKCKYWVTFRIKVNDFTHYLKPKR